MERRLAAIMAADVVGYSRLMEADEEPALTTLNAYRQVIDGLIADHRGRVFGSVGDNVMPLTPTWQGHVWRDRNFVMAGEAWSNGLSTD